MGSTNWRRSLRRHRCSRS
uniref:Uncharacterized protein n=1 Tax=Arundo donax TaxID=35708 RepID=A0A0A9D9D1_ARUDO